MLLYDAGWENAPRPLPHYPLDIIVFMSQSRDGCTRGQMYCFFESNCEILHTSFTSPFYEHHLIIRFFLLPDFFVCLLF